MGAGYGAGYDLAADVDEIEAVAAHGPELRRRVQQKRPGLQMGDASKARPRLEPRGGAGAVCCAHSAFPREHTHLPRGSSGRGLRREGGGARVPAPDCWRRLLRGLPCTPVRGSPPPRAPLPSAAHARRQPRPLSGGWCCRSNRERRYGWGLRRGEADECLGFARFAGSKHVPCQKCTVLINERCTSADPPEMRRCAPRAVLHSAVPERGGGGRGARPGR